MEGPDRAHRPIGNPIDNPHLGFTHPLRGMVFESWVVAEVAKALAHLGQELELSYYRDRKGDEVDLLVGRGERLSAIEVKSSRTVAADFFTPLARFSAWAETDAGLSQVRPIVVYGGDRRQRRRQALVIPWSGVHKLDWTG